MTGGLLDMQALADYLGVPRTWVRDKVAVRAIPYTKVGKHVRFTPAHRDAIVSVGEQLALTGPLAGRRAA